METPSEREIELLRRMTPAEKLAALRALVREAYELKAAGIRAVHPDLPDEEVRSQARAMVGGA